jgi:tellurite resistance protein
MPVACLVAVVILRPAHPEWQFVSGVVISLCLLLQAFIAWHIVAELATGQMPAELISPALYVPIVPGGFVGAMALNAVGLPGFAMLLMGMGLGGWALLEMRILNRLFSGPLMLGLRPTLGIEIAPAAVGTLAVATIWPDLPADFIISSGRTRLQYCRSGATWRLAARSCLRRGVAGQLTGGLSFGTHPHSVSDGAAVAAKLKRA